MTHIIGKPPAPKGGGNIRIEERGHGSGYRVSLSGPMSREEAERLARVLKEAADPDPVTTYGELEPGEWFRWLDPIADGHRGLSRMTIGGYADENGDEWAPAPHDQPVRRVAASVVVHEEPDFGGYVTPDGDGFRILGGPLRTRADAGHIVQQLAAWLAQEPASPESGEPEPASTWYESEAKPEPHPMAGTELTAHDMEPAEDRSEPAPGCAVCKKTSRTYYPWQLTVPGGRTTGHRSQSCAIRRSWQWYDAQQAGKGGE